MKKTAPPTTDPRDDDDPGFVLTDDYITPFPGEKGWDEPAKAPPKRIKRPRHGA